MLYLLKNARNITVCNCTHADKNQIHSQSIPLLMALQAMGHSSFQMIQASRDSQTLHCYLTVCTNRQLMILRMQFTWC